MVGVIQCRSMFVEYLSGVRYKVGMSFKTTCTPRRLAQNHHSKKTKREQRNQTIKAFSSKKTLVEIM